MSTSRAAKFIGSASEIAHYYGFRPLPEVVPEVTSTKLRSLTIPDAAAACCSKHTGAAEEPMLTFYASRGARGKESVAPARDTGEFSLQIVGCPSSIGEIHILKTLEAIIVEAEGTVACARINSLGDRDSRTRFVRELGSFLRRHGTEFEPGLEAHERTDLYENPLRAYRLAATPAPADRLVSKHAALQELLREAPRPVHYLSEKSRTHFRQVLEYLERVNFPYVIDDLLVDDWRLAGASAEPRVSFALELADGNELLTTSIGARYDDLGTRPGSRTSVPVVHASISYQSKSALSKTPPRTARMVPKVYFIQFGDSAKLTGFSVIDTLRRARIPVSQQFDARHLAPQLVAAQGLGVPYVLIMGAREAIDQTVIIRTLSTSAQTTVSIAELPRHLRALKLA